MTLSYLVVWVGLWMLEDHEDPGSPVGVFQTTEPHSQLEVLQSSLLLTSLQKHL